MGSHDVSGSQDVANLPDLSPDLDTDGDGRPDLEELRGHRIIVDASGFGLNNVGFLTERLVTSDPTKRDTDGDGLTDAEEFMLRSDPNLQDTDLDGLTDFAEVRRWQTSPVSADSDGDSRGSAPDNPRPPLSDLFDRAELKLRQDPDSGRLIPGPGATSPTLSDSDGDGVKDALDKCPKVKGDMKNGCAKDSDDDGIADMNDKCPKEAGPAPEGCPQRDSDADGILDKDDQCPKQAGVAPTGCPPDRDGDGVPDAQDACPSIPGTEANGCPPDGDGDGVFAADDKCPSEPETKNQFQDTDGCPAALPKEVTKFVGAIRGITFESGKSKIRKSSFRTLNQAVAVLKKFPGIRMEIDGHTDNQGDDTMNLDLSKARAEAVKAYLIEKGIDAGRLVAIGYGETKPTASNDTRAGRAENRRIEFRLIGKDVENIENDSTPDPAVQ